MANTYQLFLPFTVLLIGLPVIWMPVIGQKWWIAIAAAVTASLYVGLVEIEAMFPIIGLVFLALIVGNQLAAPTFLRSRVVQLAAFFLLLGTAIGLGLHVWPGFNNILIFKDVKLTSDSSPYTFFYNFDTAIAGFVLLAVCVPLASTHDQWKRIFVYSVFGSLTAIFVLLPVAWLMGVVGWAPKVPGGFFIWAGSNLFITCIAEEVVFRGIIQTRLQEWLSSYCNSPGLFAILGSSLLFGLAHMGGGMPYAILAVIAGAIYGWIYFRSSHIETSIISHFLFNAGHILLVTYPAKG